MKFEYLVSLTIIILALFVSAFLTVQALSEADIVYPVAELGGCKDKTACLRYCDDPKNIDACIAFAERHNLMSQEEIAHAKKFKDIAAQGGPGGCKTKAECESYCEDVNNIEECLAFAEQRGFLPEDELREARQVAKAIREGAELPGGCRSKQECEAYCSDTAHIEQCIAFAEKAGFMDPEEVKMVRKVLPLMVRGETPGACKSKEQCEAYCEDDAHFDECLVFAEKAGFIAPEEIELARKTGGKGPGGCRGREECETYCNTPENQQQCFAFAKEHGILREEDLAQIKDGVSRLKGAFGEAPPEVKVCLDERLGTNIIAQIESGELLPGPDIGERVRACFDEFMPDPFENIPPEVKSCVSEKDSTIFEKVKSGDLRHNEVEAIFRGCFEQMYREGGGPGFEGGPPASGSFDPLDALNRAVPEVRECIHNRIDPGFLESVRKGEAEAPELKGIVKLCYEQLGVPLPTSGGSTEPRERFDEHTQMMPGSDFSGQVEQCKQKLFGSDFQQRIQKGELTIADMQSRIETCVRESFAPPPVESFPQNHALPEFESFKEQSREFESLPKISPELLPESTIFEQKTTEGVAQ